MYKSAAQFLSVLKRVVPLVIVCCLLVVALASAEPENATAAAAAGSTPRYQIAVYYYPGYHVDPRLDWNFGKGGSEWDVLKAAQPQFPGHRQPRIPLWGYRDESNPKEMARSIDTMADNGVTTVIFDWYRFEHDSMLDGALDRGFLKAKNCRRLTFALMWANEQLSNRWRGPVSRAAFDRITDEAIRKYFVLPNYWKVDGKPYFSIYRLNDLIQGLGGLQQTYDALQDFRSRARAAGFPDVHINVIGLDLEAALDLANRKASFVGGGLVKSVADMLSYLKVDSVTWYTWSHVAFPNAPTETYRHWAGRSVALWVKWQRDLRIPFYPNVSLGWDPTPRYYGSPVVIDNTPDAVRPYLEKAKSFMDNLPPTHRILTIYSWNEWTEGGVLEPEVPYGLQYLQTIRDVFGADGPNIKR